MGTIQNSLNQSIATIAGAATLGKHISNQNKEIAVKKIEAEKEVFNAENELKANTENVMQKVVEEEAEGTYKGPTGSEEEMVNAYLDEKSELAEDKYQQAMSSVKHPAKSKRVQAARTAAIEAQDAINMRRNLKFDSDIAKKKLEALGGKK